MPDTIRPIERFLQFLDYKGDKPTPTEKALGLPNSYIRKSKESKGYIGPDGIEKIHSFYPDLNIYWLLFGEGEMLVTDQVSSSKTTKETLNKHVPQGKTAGNAQVNAQETAQETRNINPDCAVCEEKQNLVESLRENIKAKDALIESKEEQIALLKTLLNPSKSATDEDSQSKDQRAVV